MNGINTVKRILYLLCCVPLFAFGQDKDESVRFVDAASWQAVLAQAQAENKLIFLDAYATWCEPCKKMDKEVYQQADVGRVLNRRFISVKVQMDVTPNDDAKIKQWYAHAELLKNKYRVNSFPSFLFFSPDGRLLHRSEGFNEARDFMRMAGEADSLGKQLYRTLVENYQQGRRDYSVAPYLAKMSRQLRDRELTDFISQDYLNNYLYKKSDDELLTKENLEFISTFMKSSKEKGFALFYNNISRINQLTQERYAEGVVTLRIAKDEIDPYADVSGKSATPPDWNRVERNIKQYGALGEEAYLRAKTYYYINVKDMPKFSLAIVEYLGKHPNAEGANNLNNFAWNVFESSSDKAVLKSALSWSERAMQLEEKQSGKASIQVTDTHANLLHKFGKTKEAIAWEEKALNAALELKSDYYVKLFRETIEKMKKGEPTWPTG